jgi:hypothetical protein
LIDELVENLKALKYDPGRAIDLYKRLYSESFFAFVKAGPQSSVNSLLFLTYLTVDGVRELPALEEFVMRDLALESMLIHINGPILWDRMLDIVESGMCEVAVDPSQPHGIRLNREMILGMVSKYGVIPT